MRRAGLDRGNALVVQKVAQGQLDLFADQWGGKPPPGADTKPSRAAVTRETPKTMPVKQALRRYGIGRTKFYELLASGAIKASKLGTKTLIDVETADSFFNGLPNFPRRL